MIYIAGLGSVGMGKVLKLESGLCEFVFMHFGLAMRSKPLKYATVFPQYMVDFSNQIIGVAILAIIIAVSTLIRTKFFVGPANQRITTIKASPFHVLRSWFLWAIYEKI